MAKKREATPKVSEERETRVLLEEIRTNVKTVAEQHGSIKEEINNLRNSMESRFNIVELAVMENSRKISELKSGQEELTSAYKGLKSGQEELTSAYKGLKSGQEELKSGQEELTSAYKGLKFGQEELIIRQERMEQKLDTNIANHEKRIIKIEEKIGV